MRLRLAKALVAFDCLMNDANYINLSYEYRSYSKLYMRNKQNARSRKRQV
jgi:hypothetical protein